MTSWGRCQAGGGARAPVARTLAAVLAVLAALAAGCAPVHRTAGAGQRGSPGASQPGARSSSVTGLVSFTDLHRAADAAVEAQVRILRRALGLPPPESS